MLIDNHEKANRGKVKGSHLTFKTTNLQDVIYTTIGDDNVRSFNILLLYVTVFFPSAETQAMFNNFINKFL